MKKLSVFVQSRSGDFNTSLDFECSSSDSLFEIMKELRRIGGYLAEYRNTTVFVPFEEIQFIREMGPDE